MKLLLNTYLLISILLYFSEIKLLTIILNYFIT